MKNKKTIAIIITFIITFILTIILFASVSKAQASDDIMDWNFSVDQPVPSKVINVAGFIIKFLRNMSIIITILVITVLGIQYMLGSIEEKANYKKTSINIIIGVVFITLVTSIVDVIFSAFNL